MVSTLMRSSLREIKQSLGRYLAILAIVGLGVGFFAGLRMAQPDMLATGVEYLDTQQFHDIRLLSTLGFTEEDVSYFAGLDGVTAARGSIYTEFLYQAEDDSEQVLMAHSLTDGINKPSLQAGRMPETGSECLGDSNYFTEADIGKTIRVSTGNDEDTLDLLAYDEYTLVGLAQSPLYLNFQRGTSSIGSGSVSAFVLIPEDGFDFEAYYEIYLTLTDMPEAYSTAYDDRIDDLKPELERLAEERGDLRYTTLYEDAMAEIRDGEQELADGWEEYRTERADAEQELADAYQELLDAEDAYNEALADYEQGKLDYADGLKEYEDALAEIADAEQELADGWAEYYDGKAQAEAELADACQQLTDGEAEYKAGLTELQNAQAELADARAQLEAADRQMEELLVQLTSSESQLKAAKEQLDQGESAYTQALALYHAGQSLVSSLSSQGLPISNVDELLVMTEQNAALAAQIDGALQMQGSSLDEFRTGWTAAGQALGGSLTEESLNVFRAQLDTGKANYENGKSQYEDGLSQYQAARAELDASWQELLAGEDELNSAEQELQSARTELDNGWTEYYDGKAKAEQELDDAYQQLTDGQLELNDAKAQLSDARQELKDAEQELNDAPAEFADARAELDDGWSEYHDGKAEADQEFADAELELTDGEQEIADAYEKLSDLKEPDVYVLTRNENNGYACFDNDTSIVAAISVVFPVFFFLVAALVCMTTMTRMVDEQRTQTGVLKALGYSNRQIMWKYLFYSGSAATIGSVIGYAIGSFCLPWVIWEIYGIMYSFAELKYIFDPILALISFAAALLCSMGATWFACRMELAQPAAELIRPKAPKAGKRVFLEYITPLWKRLSFLQKVSVRNVLRYRSRLVMMILGIGGCTALLVTGFGLRDSVASVVDDQFDQITLFDYSVTFRDAQTQGSAAEYLAERGWQEEDALLVHSGSTDIVSNNVSKSVYLVISSVNNLDGFIDLHSGEETIPYPGPDEVVLNLGLAEDLGVTTGDTVELRDNELGSITATVSAICDNYVFNYVYLAPETYEQQLGQLPEYQTLYLLAHDGADPYAESVSLSDSETVSNVTVNQSTREQVNSMLSRLDYIVIVVVVCAAALAFIVLYNLTNINITERIREIATIKVLGFYQNEVASYVFRELRILAVVGSLFGLLMGKALHLFVMAQVQVAGMFFPCKIAPTSYLISVALTIFFTVLITYFMRPKLQKVDMAESLKSIE